MDKIKASFEKRTLKKKSIINGIHYIFTSENIRDKKQAKIWKRHVRSLQNEIEVS